MSDDAAGGIPAAEAADGTTGSVRTDDVVHGGLAPEVPGKQEMADMHGRDDDLPPHDPTYDTGMLPVGSPEMPPMRVESPAQADPAGPRS